MSKNQKRAKSIVPYILVIIFFITMLDRGFGIVAKPIIPLVIIFGVVAIMTGVNKHKKNNANYPTDGSGNYINRNYGGGAGNDPHNLDGINKGQTLNSDTFDEGSNGVEPKRTGFEQLEDSADEFFKKLDGKTGFDEYKKLSMDSKTQNEHPNLNNDEYREMMSEKEGMHDLLAAGIIDKNEYDDRLAEIKRRY